MRLHILIIIFVIVLLLLIYMNRNKIIANVTQKLSTNFTLGELLVTNKPFPNIPNKQEIGNLTLLALNVLQPVRDLLKVPIAIHSAFRSHEVNKSVGGVDNSQHRLGFAADFHAVGIPLMETFRRIAKSDIPYDQLIIEYGKHPETESDDWIHISYNPKGGRKQLLTARFDSAKNKMVYSPITV